jgi:hypothetical protein
MTLQGPQNTKTQNTSCRRARPNTKTQNTSPAGEAKTQKHKAPKHSTEAKIVQFAIWGTGVLFERRKRDRREKLYHSGVVTRLTAQEALKGKVS